MNRILDLDVAKPVQKVLVVDDDPVVIRAMSLMLQRAGLMAVGCSTARAAMDRAADGIAAAILDIHLPDESGLWLSQQMREQWGPARPIIILSGDHSMDTIRALPGAGATYFFSKPVNGAMLIEKLQEWLRESA